MLRHLQYIALLIALDRYGQCEGSFRCVYNEEKGERGKSVYFCDLGELASRPEVTVAYESFS